LMSDDSIQEALLELPDVDCWNSVKSDKSSQSLDVFEDTQITIPDVVDTNAVRYREDEPGRCRAAEAPANSPRASKPTGSTGEGTEQEARAKPAGPSLSRFSYSPTTWTQETRSHGLPASASNGMATRLAASLPTLATPMMTPLQRMQAQAMTRGRDSPVTFKPADSAKERNRASAGRSSIPMFPLNPSFVPLPKVDPDEVAALNQVMGSEDHIIHDSDGENDPHTLDEPSPSRLDLSRFLYA